MLPLEPGLYFIALFVVAGGAVVQGAIGMGFGQIAAAGLIWIAPEMVPASVILMALVVSSISAGRERFGIEPKTLLTALFGRIAGTLLAIFLLVLVGGNHAGFTLLFAGLILVSVASSLVKAAPQLSGITLVTGGAASGLMGTITSVGAPPMGLVFQDVKASRARPTLNAFFAIGAVVSLLGLWYAGRFTTEHVIFACFMAPGFISGTFLSGFLYKYIDSRFRYMILLFSTISALALIARSLL